jgi:hypothetical protein
VRGGLRIESMVFGGHARVAKALFLKNTKSACEADLQEAYLHLRLQ